MSLLLTAAPLMVNIMMKYLVADKSSRNCVEGSYALQSSYGQKQIALKPEYRVCDELFQRLLKAEDQAGEYINEGGHADVPNPLRNYRSAVELLEFGARVYSSAGNESLCRVSFRLDGPESS